MSFVGGGGGNVFEGGVVGVVLRGRWMFSCVFHAIFSV